MPTPAYVQLNSITLAAASSSIIFNNIPQNYKDLVLVINAKHSYAGSIGVRDNGVRFNSDSSSTYFEVYTQGNGSSASSSTSSATTAGLLYGMASADFLPSTFTVFDYSATNKQKPYYYRAGAGYDSNYGIYTVAGGWPSTAAITSITIAPSGSYTLLTGSTFTLYGIVG